MVSVTNGPGALARLGRTGYEVSRLGFGTVELGMSYGLPAAGDFPAPPADDEAVALLHAAFAAGVNFVDTAPGYGRAEELVGRALASWRGPAPIVATKVTCPDAAQLADGAALADLVERSVETSRRRLDRDQIALLQVHNATVEALESAPFLEALQRCVERGWVAHLGASTYGAEAARAAIDGGACATLQLAYSVLDQQPAEEVIERAREADVGVIARSVLLKGVLGTPGELPERLQGLAPTVSALDEIATAAGETVAESCLRFVLSNASVATAILGIDRRSFLDADLRAWQRGPLDEAALARLEPFHVGGALTDPRTWGF